MTLLMNPLWAMAADNNVPEDVQQQENRSTTEADEQLPEKQTSEAAPVESANKDTKNYDTTKPVINDVIWDYNGKTLSQNDTLKIGVKAHDDDSGINTVEVRLVFCDPTVIGMQDYQHLDLKQSTSDPSLYEAEYSLNGTTLPFAYIDSITATDYAGTSITNNNLFDPTDGSHTYHVNIIPKQIDDIVISDFKFSKKNTEITYEDRIDISFNITSNLDYQSKGFFILKFYKEDSSNNREYLTICPSYVPSSNNYEGEFSFSKSTSHGKWIFDSLIYTEKGREFSVKGVNTTDTWFEFINSGNDIESPEFLSLSVDKDHKFVTAGDTVTFTVKARDNEKLAPSASLLLTPADTSHQERQSVDLKYNEKDDVYVGNLTIPDTMYPCEWYVEYLFVSDLNDNTTNHNFYPSFSHYIKVKQGNTFVNPTYSIPVIFFSFDKDLGWIEEQVTYYENVEHRTTLKELGVVFPKNPNIPGLTFEGWSTYFENLPIDENYAVLNNNSIMIYPVYDKSIVNTTFLYYDKDGNRNHFNDVQFLPKDTPVQTILDQIHATKLPELYPGLTFKNWDVPESAGANEKVADRWSQTAFALYDKELVRFWITDNYENIDSDEFHEEDWKLLQCVIGEVGDTVPVLKSNDVYERFIWPDYPNCETEGILVDMYGTDVYGYGIKRGEEAPPTPLPIPKPDQVPTTPPGVTLPNEQVDIIVDKLEKAPAGEKTTIDMGNATVVPKQILETIKGKDVTVTLDMGGYTWTLNGKNVSADKLKDINLEVKFDTNAVPNKTIKEFAGDNPTKQLSLTHNGNFGFQAELTLNAGKEYAGKHANLFWYDSDKKMKFVDAGKIQPDGSVSLTFTHASDYILVMADEVMDTAGDKTNNTSNTTSVQTGDTTSIFAIVVVMIVALAVVMVILNRNKKRH